MSIFKFIIIIIGIFSFPLKAMPSSPFGPAIKDAGGAVAINEKSWITLADYPAHLINDGIGGRVVVAIDISSNGRVSACRITESSGQKALDEIPCKKLLRKARFRAATSVAGNPIATKGTWSFDFWVPN